jgi:hypothetical protein
MSEADNTKREDVYGHWRGGKLKDFLPILQKIATGDMDEWYWGYNPQCKYISIHMDTRDGDYVSVFERENKILITHEQLEEQRGKKPQPEKIESLPTGQSKLGSLIEISVSLAIGMSLSILSYLIILPAIDIHVAFMTNVGLTLWFTVLSFIRGYFVRRWFNARFHRLVLKLTGEKDEKT